MKSTRKIGVLRQTLLQNMPFLDLLLLRLRLLMRKILYAEGQI